jgi:YesN/AraC family two-component response regulator
MPSEVLKRVSILIVEDDDESITPLEFILKRYTENIYIENNGKDGLASYIENRPDIVLTDIQMPIMDGIEMAEAIRSINSHAQIVYVSAHSEIDLILKAIEAGADGFILKPISKDKLIARLEKSAKIVLSDKCIAQDEDFFEKYLSW